MGGRQFDDEYTVNIESFIYQNKPRENMLLPSDQKRIEIADILPSCHDYLKKQGKLEALPIITHKTDFAEGYEKKAQLDSLLNSPDRSLQYTEVFLYGLGHSGTRLYMVGIPDFDEIRKDSNYNYLKNMLGDNLTVSATTYQYGNGEPLKPEEIPKIADITEALYEIHDYLEKHDLSEEISWKDFTQNIKVSRTLNVVNEISDEYEYEDGYEP